MLVVDDEEMFRYVLRQHLLAARHVIFEAATGDEALRLARAERPDVICLDLEMPDIDGAEVLRRLREDPGTRDIPVADRDRRRRSTTPARRQLGELSAATCSPRTRSRARARSPPSTRRCALSAGAA